jgi:tRNA (guanine37-N1)-methyltransferase
MGTPCVRVAREDGEATRERLAEADLLDDTREIVHEDGALYLPVTDPRSVPEVYDVVERDAPRRSQQTRPADLLGYDPGYERLGEVVILDEDDARRAREIADAVIVSDLPVRTVLNRASKVKGELRVREWDVLACDAHPDADPERPAPEGHVCTETVHREYGYEYALNLASVYFSPRLATERHRVVEAVGADEHALDMFAGVGPFAVPMADRGAETVGVDLNEVAVEYLRENAARNGVAENVTAVAGDVRGATDEYADWADRLVMNLPHSADEFLETAVELASDDCRLHYYDIQHEDDPFGPGTEAIRAAAEDAGYEVTVDTEHVVRSYAPHELNVCLDVRLRR